MAQERTRTRTAVSWVNKEGRVCITATPETWCFCGHRFKVHLKDDGSFRCTARGCLCAKYDLHVAQGAWQVRCRCKHAHTDHLVGQPGRPCGKLVGGKACKCASFDSPYVCTCDLGWAEHATVFRQVALPAEPLGAGLGLSEAEAHAIDEMATLPTAASAALTLNDVRRGREQWAEGGPPGCAAGRSGAAGEAAQAQHAMAVAPPAALASLKRRAGSGGPLCGQPARPGAEQARAAPRAAPSPAGPVDLSLLRAGQQLEAQFGNGVWYRATVTRVLSAKGDGMVAVRFVDDDVAATCAAGALRLLP